MWAVLCKLENNNKKTTFNFNHIASKIAYPCIFCISAEAAINNLFRLIISKECGFDEGADFWLLALKSILVEEFELLEFNKFGATFNENEWREILNGIINRINSFSKL